MVDGQDPHRVSDPAGDDPRRVHHDGAVVGLRLDLRICRCRARGRPEGPVHQTAERYADLADAVYADLLDRGCGGFAEYVSVPVDVMSLKLANLSLEEAAAVPVAAVTALQGLRYHGEIQPVQKVLINGASGGIGIFAVQIAKSCGPEVTGVTSTRNVDLVRSLGADHVIDYTTTDFVRSGRRYDLIVDTVGNQSVPDLRRSLADGGKAAVVGFTSVTKLMAVSLGGKDIAMVSAHVGSKDLEVLSGLIEAGKVYPEIDRRYPFAEIPAAIAFLEQGHARGKAVAGVA